MKEKIFLQFKAQMGIIVVVLTCPNAPVSCFPWQFSNI